MRHRGVATSFFACYTDGMILYSDSETPPLSPRPNLAVLASGSGSNFAAICDAVDRDDLQVNLCGLVFNNPDAYVAERAAKRGIPAMYVDHRDYDSREQFDAAVVRALKEIGADWVAMAGWMRICTDVLLDAYPDRILNIHPSLLPAFRGLHAVEQSIAAGVRVAGCSVHLVRSAVDDGPIIAQAAVQVETDDDAAALHARIHVAEHVLYPMAIAIAIARTQ